MTSITSLVQLQDDICNRLSKAKINYKKAPKDRLTSQYIETRLETVEDLWSQFNKGHVTIIKNTKSEELLSSPYTTKETYDKTEELYIELKCELKTVLDKIREPSVAQNSGLSLQINSGGNNTSLQLPHTKIPTFSGKYVEWPTFRDLFLSAIHSNLTIAKVQKLYYLKSYLAGEAEQLLRRIPVAESNYERAWKLLESRYNNKKYLSHCIIKRLLSQKNITSESASALKDLMDTTTDCLDALSDLGVDVTSWDILIIHIISLKLDPERKREWELRISSSIESDDLPTLNQFKEFLTSRYRAFEFLDESQRSQRVQSNKTKVFHIATLSCQYCREAHKIGTCKQFIDTDVDMRRKFVLDNKLCFNCLGYNHSAKVCKCATTCRICKRRHHSLLHPEGERESNDQTMEQVSTTELTNTVDVEDSSEVVTCFSKGSTTKQVLLSTALVRAISKSGVRYTVRALLDQGSQASFVTESVVQSLGLKKQTAKGIISGVGGGNPLISSSMVEIKLQSRVDSSMELVVKAYVLKSITSILPAKETACLEELFVSDIQLADPRYHIPNKVDMLLGAEIFPQVIQEGLRKSRSGQIIAQCTTLGWILSGTVKSAVNNSSNISVLHVHLEAEEMLKKFWELEKEPKESIKLFTEEESRCEEIFKLSTTRDKSGRYVVNLPFRTKDPSCKYGGSRNLAIKRFQGLENKLNRNPELKAQYSAVIKEYLSLDHMEPISENDKQNDYAVYLPHHAVIRNDKETTRVRVVFDASSKGNNGASLNDDLLIGPTLQPDLRHLLLRWRVHPICLIADIVKMYRQVRVHKQHTDFQRIVWRDDKKSEIKDYKLLTVTFGTASAPFLAVRAMHQTAYDEGKDYPLASERVLKDYYMDDLMTGCETVQNGIEIYNQMTQLLNKGGFELQKWSSNSNELLEKLLEGKNKECHNEEKGIKVKQDDIIKTLGLTWNRSRDIFQYSVQLEPILEPVTKRKLLSDISRLFDPLGWVAPVVIIAKIFIQKLWITGIGWDDAIPDDIKQEWSTYRQELSLLTELAIPRWLSRKGSDKRVELHGFCDASKAAYAAVIYIRVIDADDIIHVTLLSAKTNVAPIKTVSIPRLELCGAVLLVKLLVEVSEIMGIDKSYLHAWTDSEIVLAWLNSHPNRWKTFVANRVTEILSVTEPQQWNHVQSKDNPADCASRGLYPSELLKSELWLNGPNFLQQKVIQFGKCKNITTSMEEIKSHVVSKVSKDPDHWIWDKYTSLTKLVRVIAYCRRVLNWKTRKSERNTGYLTAEELRLALNTCIRECQGQGFQEEIRSLQQGKIIKGKGLSSLNPYLDSFNILRVGGRLERSGLSFNRKHPILLPRKSPLTDLLISEAHRLTLHGGSQLMQNYLGTKYHILGLKERVRSYVRRCPTCLRYNTASKHQLMRQLPAARVTPSRPFSNSGVDYAGPINLRTSKGRGHHAYKGYICLFVCMVTKALHLEVVSDLTAAGFLAAFKRFVARRGHCKDIWSDNGTNFQGASKELQTLFLAEKSGIAKEIAETLANEGTEWHFIPPHAPNFGGLWEAGIKSCKQHLRKVIGGSTLTYEEMSTLLSQVEACLNSRPLCRLPDVDGADALTPGHFLVGEPLVNAPDHNYETANISTLRRWHLVQKMTQEFWRRWSMEYLTTYLHRYKWSKQTPEPNIGDIVLVKEDNLPPCKWLLGRVIEKHPGQDNLTRVITLRAGTSSIKRPTSKLCVLPVG